MFTEPVTCPPAFVHVPEEDAGVFHGDAEEESVRRTPDGAKTTPRTTGAPSVGRPAEEMISLPEVSFMIEARKYVLPSCPPAYAYGLSLKAPPDAFCGRSEPTTNPAFTTLPELLPSVVLASALPAPRTRRYVRD